jgi:hypothetical protein
MEEAIIDGGAILGASCRGAKRQIILRDFDWEAQNEMAERVAIPADKNSPLLDFLEKTITRRYLSGDRTASLLWLKHKPPCRREHLARLCASMRGGVSRC